MIRLQDWSLTAKPYRRDNPCQDWPCPGGPCQDRPCLDRPRLDRPHLDKSCLDRLFLVAQVQLNYLTVQRKNVRINVKSYSKTGFKLRQYRYRKTVKW
jgi:hypothetical protein